MKYIVISIHENESKRFIFEIILETTNRFHHPLNQIRFSRLSLSLSEVNKGPVKMNLVRLINRNWIVKDPIFCRENEISVVNEIRSPRRTRSSSRLEYRAFAYRLSGYSWGQCTRCRGEGLRLDVGKHNDPANVSLL